jgi:hypothetical protein
VTTLARRHGLGVFAAIALCGCDDPTSYALYVGTDLTPEGGAPALDSTTDSPPPMRKSGAEAIDADPNQGAGDAGAFVYWTEWQSVDAGTVSGIVSLPSGAIRVVYSGDLHGAQTTTGTDEFTPGATFTSATVADPPPGPGMIEVSGESTQIDAVTFSEPVSNPVLAVYNLGTGFAEESASLLFDVPVTVLSSGLNAGGVMYFGNEMLVAVDGGVSGVGGNGVVELEGTFSTIAWTNPNDTPYASYTGLTVGLRAQSSGLR